jgi:hypothetical protein
MSSVYRLWSFRKGEIFMIVGKVENRSLETVRSCYRVRKGFTFIKLVYKLLTNTDWEQINLKAILFIEDIFFKS